MSGPYIGGNFWASPQEVMDFPKPQRDADGDGIADTRYTSDRWKHHRYDTHS